MKNNKSRECCEHKATSSSKGILLKDTIGVASSGLSAQHRFPDQIWAQMCPLSGHGLWVSYGQCPLFLPQQQEPQLFTRPHITMWAEGRGVNLWESLEGRKQFILLGPSPDLTQIQVVVILIESTMCQMLWAQILPFPWTLPRVRFIGEEKEPQCDRNMVPVVLGPEFLPSPYGSKASGHWQVIVKVGCSCSVVRMGRALACPFSDFSNPLWHDCDGLVQIVVLRTWHVLGTF